MNNSIRSSQIGPPRFGIAVHALVWLAQSDCLLSSATIAGQVNSHATFLRRVLSSLIQSGMVEAREGRDGGYFLKKPADQITLADVYVAVKSEDMEAIDTVDCGEAGEELERALGDILQDAERQAVEVLKRYSIADLLRTVPFEQKNQ